MSDAEPDEIPGGWDGLPSTVRIALLKAWERDVPGLASAVHGRWWQLETWLRSLCYVELRAAYGAEWTDVIGRAASRADAELRYAHMPSTDTNLVLAHLDVTPLLQMLDDDWQLFGPSLIDREIWKGRVRELKQVRHRMAHCRRPHADDLSRIEQMLRDLERGAFQAVASYNKLHDPAVTWMDPVVDGWLRGKHPKSYIMEHAERKYDVQTRISYSRRPWADDLPTGDLVTGTPGYLWHVDLYMNERGVLPDQVWNDSYVRGERLPDRVVYVSQNSPAHVSFSFPAVNDPARICDDINLCIHAVLSASRPFRDTTEYDRMVARMRRDVDPRVQVCTIWSLLDDSTVPVSIFGG
ncbi:hypothetical protein HCA58_04830 [Micromonospora sp. HNM0581]|uniref:Swt1 family HEPN domain-containing protein n=1 Tax=Micromonospora sp. HNM0581 TaxID=2716341 RepID=UPI00146ACE1B|nr:Swt1 family HEPN domain-containing protein [Micromonospora sp. HNM0581]NLU77731.1 hypothetical protein [Micromonospora sp. HNM0581]